MEIVGLPSLDTWSALRGAINRLGETHMFMGVYGQCGGFYALFVARSELKTFRTPIRRSLD